MQDDLITNDPWRMGRILKGKANLVQVIVSKELLLFKEVGKMIIELDMENAANAYNKINRNS